MKDILSRERSPGRYWKGTQTLGGHSETVAWRYNQRNGAHTVLPESNSCGLNSRGVQSSNVGSRIDIYNGRVIFRGIAALKRLGERDSKGGQNNSQEHAR